MESTNSKSFSSRILDIIASRDGMRFREIQSELFKMSKGVHLKPGQHRGWWCTPLVGGMYYGPGLLKQHCVKGNDGLWRIKPISVGFGHRIVE